MIKEIEAKSLLRKYKKVDSWFIAAYGMNIYRGCLHNCAYCDGRAEGYYVEGEFGRDLDVKINAPELLDRELNPARKRKPFRKSYIIAGGGVGDAYQPIETKYGLTRQILQIIHKYKHPVHILTKSSLVTRDIDIIEQINDQSGAIVSFSFSSMDADMSNVIEPWVPSPDERLETIRMFKTKGITCGIYFMPIIPFITDTTEKINKVFYKAKEIGVDFIIFGGLTLKPGRQKDYFINTLTKYDANLIHDYNNIYLNNKWGMAKQQYYNALNKLVLSVNKKYNIPLRIPSTIYKNILDENDFVSVILEQLDYLLKIRGEKSPYGYAAYNISQLSQPISSIKNDLRSIKGIGNITERLILEIMSTGRSGYYDKLLHG